MGEVGVCRASVYDMPYRIYECRKHWPRSGQCGGVSSGQAGMRQCERIRQEIRSAGDGWECVRCAWRLSEWRVEDRDCKEG